MLDIHLWPLRLGEEKEEEEEDRQKLQGKNIMAPYYIGRP